MQLSEQKWELVATLARERGVKDAALTKWRQRNRVPSKYHLPLLADAKAKELDLKESDFFDKDAA